MNTICAEWHVPADHPVFAGHFPQRPIVPGALLLDRALRLAAETGGAQRWSIVRAKFLRPVTPGERLTIRLLPAAGGALGLAIRCGEDEVASGLLQPEPA